MHRNPGLAEPPSLASLIASGPVSLFLDFDGTLVEIASRPDAIDVRESLNLSLERLAARVEGRCALVSGRSVDELQHYVGAASIGWAGSHGADVRAQNGNQIGKVPNGLSNEVEELLKRFSEARGVDFEEKPHGGALHYRNRPEEGEATHDFVEKLAAEHGLRAQSGKFVAELVANISSKAEAVHAFMAQPSFAGSRPFFLGDDLTDEAGFEACAQLGGAGVIVGERAQQKSETKAEFALPDVASVHVWLDL